MTNVIQEKENAVPVKKRKENAVPCFALSKNDSYLMSASGGKISLFSVMTFKVKYISWSQFFFLTFPYAFRVNAEHATGVLILYKLISLADNYNIYGSSACCNFSRLPSPGQQFYCHRDG